MFMVKAIMDAMLRQDQPDGAFQLLQQAKEVGIPATDILHGTLMRLSLTVH
jgi:pentatricopeptide repeat protein